MHEEEESTLSTGSKCFEIRQKHDPTCKCVIVNAYAAWECTHLNERVSLVRKYQDRQIYPLAQIYGMRQHPDEYAKLVYQHLYTLLELI